MSKITTNFQLQEFVHPLLWVMLGERSYDWLNPIMPQGCQELRDEFGGIIINDWLWKLKEDELLDERKWDTCFTDSGLRVPHFKFGAKYSAHKGGCGSDLKFDDADPIQVYHYILQHPDDYPFITRMENAEKTKTWLHTEFGRRTGKIITYDP